MQQIDRGQRLEGRDVAGAGHHYFRPRIFVVARPFPDTDSSRAMLDRGVDVEPLRRRLLACDDNVDAVPAFQAVIGDEKQRVRVGRQVDPHDVGLLVADIVDEARILVAEPVMVLAPDMRGQQIIERRDWAAPRNFSAYLQPLCMLIEHRIDDVDKRLVTVEKPMAAGQQIAFKPALAGVLGEDFHDAAVARQVVVVGQGFGVPRAVRRLEDMR